MLTIGDQLYWSQPELQAHLRQLGLKAGDEVMLHAGMRQVGPLLNGPDALIAAILAVLGPQGTLLCYTNWDQQYEDALDGAGAVPSLLKPHIPPFDPLTSRASRDHGVIAECVRSWPGALRSGNPGASVAAIGAQAAGYTELHALQYGYGMDSPFARLVARKGRVLMVGAPLDTVSLLHHAEHLADIPHKRVVRMEVPLSMEGEVFWTWQEEFDTCDPVVDGLAENYFADIVQSFLLQDGCLGEVGYAASVLLPADRLVAYAVDWLENWSNQQA